MADENGNAGEGEGNGEGTGGAQADTGVNNGAGENNGAGAQDNGNGGANDAGGAGSGSGSAGDGDKGASAWGDLDADLKAFVGEKTPAQIAKELQGAQSLLGKKTIGIPNKESKPEEWKAFHKARGVPEDETGYDFAALRDEALKDIPEDQRDAAWDKDEEAYWRGVFKNSNVSQTEATEIMRRGLEKRLGEFTATAEAERKIGKQVSDKITEDWGPKKDEYTQDANNFARHIGLADDMVDAMMKLPGVTAETRFNLLEFMRTQGALLREGGQTGRPGAAPTAGNMTPDQARVAKDQYLDQGDNRVAYMESSHPRHKEVTAQVTTYLKIERGQGKS